MLPLLGTVKLIRKYFEDKHYGKCPKCKTVYDIEIMTDGKHKLLDGEVCPRCNVLLKPEKRWSLKCPKCGVVY